VKRLSDLIRGERPRLGASRRKKDAPEAVASLFDVEKFIGLDHQEEPPNLIEVMQDCQTQMNAELNFFRPSGLFRCERAAVFSYRNAKKSRAQTDPTLMRILDEGTAVHTVVQRYLGNDRHKYYFVPEARSYTKIGPYAFSGSCDGILIRRSDNYRWAIEIKTISEKGFDKLGRKAKREHERQAVLYALAHKVWWVSFLYWNKSNGTVKTFNFKADQKTVLECTARMDHLYAFVKANKLPQFDARQCNPGMCPHVEICKKNGGNP